MKKTGRRWRIAVPGALIASLLLSLLSPIAPAVAVTGAEFDPGNIISDARFHDSASMDADQIQSFLQIRVPNCTPGYTCLKDYRQSTPNRAADTQCAAYSGAANERASTIIAKVSVACGINPQVLLVLLQKEQSLVTSSSPSPSRYDRATGYACPDTSGCDAAYFGFFNQVYNAAWQFRRYEVNTSYFSWFRPGRVTNVRFHPNGACGATPVFIQNQATANLYYYTPYTPNSAALNNLRGTGDGCSSYGNRNFWVFFNDWFGSPTGPTNPFGNIDRISMAPGGVSVTGWAIDPSQPDSIDVHFYAPGFVGGTFANALRDDVANAYPLSGAGHGFDTFIPVPGTGAQRICAFGINIGAGINSLLECALGTPGRGSPIGYLDAVDPVPGGAAVSGWTIDPDITEPGAVHIYVDGVFVSGAVADASRVDLVSVYPAYGAEHGFSTTILAPPGSRNFCVYSINTAAGTLNPLLGCRRIMVPIDTSELGRRPFGNVDIMAPSTGGISILGWAIDPDTTASADIHVYVDGQFAAGMSANSLRTDVGSAYPGYGDSHGFTGTIPAATGARSVCVFAIDTVGGANTLMTCRTVTVP